MPAFFVPFAADDAQAQKVLEATKQFNSVPNAEALFKISYIHNGQRLVATVGEPDPLMGEIVLIILYDEPPGPYLVCTENRGVVRGGPILAAADWQTHATAFDPQ